MSDASGGDNWWQASDGKWYPPSDQPPAPGWWLAADGQWYPPADVAPQPGWWLAADGQWYSPEGSDTTVEPQVPAAEPAIATERSVVSAAPVADGKGRKPAAAPAPVEGAPVPTAPLPGPRQEAPAAEASPPTKPSKDATPSDPTETPSAAPTTAAAPEPATAAPEPTAAPPAQTAASPASLQSDEPAPSAPAKPTAKKTIKKVTKKVVKRRASAPKADADDGGAPKPSMKPASASPTPAQPDAAAAEGPTRQPAPSAPTEPSPQVAPPAVTSSAAHDGSPARAFSDTSPEHQIAVRNQASRADAQVLSRARSAAAAQALAKLKASMDDDEPARISEPVAAVTEPEAQGADSASSSGPNKSAKRPTDRHEPIMEVRPVPYATDVDHIGDRLAIFEDRVELQDRNGKLRSEMAGDQIADIVVTRRLKTAVLTVEAGEGTTIQIKGLRPEQADEARELIMRNTRRSGPAPTRPPKAAKGTPDRVGRKGTKPTREQLLRMLDLLHRAGVLTDAELADKRAVVDELHEHELTVQVGQA